MLSYMPSLASPRLDSDALLAAPGGGTWLQPPGQPRRMLRYAPEFIDDWDGTGLFAGIGAATYRSPPVFVTVARDAELVGYRCLLADGGFRTDELLPDEASQAAFAAAVASADPFLNEDTGLRPTPRAGLFTLDRTDRPARHIPGTTALLCSHEPSNYGSLLFRVVPKLVTLRQLGLDGLPMLAWVGIEAFRQVFAALGIEGEQLIPHEPLAVTRLDRAVAPSLRNPHAFLDRDSYALMQGLADRFRGRLSGRRLYISRLRHGKVAGSTRVLQNEDALAAAVGRLNFEVIEPERLSFAEQVETFESADMIVGPSGSAMFNVMFCRPGTKVIDIESEPHWIYAHTGLFASCQTRYGLIVGRPDPADERPVHRRWTVDVERVMDRIASFIHA